MLEQGWFQGWHGLDALVSPIQNCMGTIAGCCARCQKRHDGMLTDMLPGGPRFASARYPGEDHWPP